MNKGDKGICRLNLIPVRSEGKDGAEMVTQLLFGDHFEVIGIEEKTNWLKIKIVFDKYEGWIDYRQFTLITEEYFNQINNSNYKISLDVSSSILHNKNHINIVLGSVLPISTNEIFKMEEQLAFNGESKSLSEKRDFDYLKLVALKFINAPYLWGGKSPFGIDCSGFTQQVFRICGYNLKRDASQQFLQGNDIEKGILPGDLVFFKNDADKISHVGIALENDKIIHASGKVRIDTLDDKGIYNSELLSHTHRLAGAKRIIRS